MIITPIFNKKESESDQISIGDHRERLFSLVESSIKEQVLLSQNLMETSKRFRTKGHKQTQRTPSAKQTEKRTEHICFEEFLTGKYIAVGLVESFV